MCRGITEPGKMYIDMDAHIPRIQAINEAARRIGAPVIFTTVAYHKDLADAGTFGKKMSLVQKPAAAGRVIIARPFAASGLLRCQTYCGVKPIAVSDLLRRRWILGGVRSVRRHR